MVMLTNSPDGEEWAADLRISLPVSKAVLVNQQPIEAFRNSLKAYEFSERIAAKIRRPAVHDAVVELARNIDALIKRQRSGGAQWVDRVEQIRARARSGTLLQPASLELIVITIDDPLTPEDKEPLRMWRSSEQGAFRLKTGGTLIPLRFILLDKIKIQDYRESVPLILPELGRPAFW
jgi:hypothetical protein